MADIDLSRLRGLLDGINGFGRDSVTGGYNRLGYSEADMASRRWFSNQMIQDGLAVRMDAAANVFGRFGSDDGPCILVGSHLDTVRDGGAFDGSLGAAVALECVRAMKTAGLAPKIAIEVVATAEEEGRFGGMLGSQAITGRVSRDWIEAAVDADGVRLVDAMRAQGLDPFAAADVARAPEEIRAFLELHVEQGPVLEALGQPIGVAHSISGLRYLHVRLLGRANHSGTTPMGMRADAFSGLAQVGMAIPDVVARLGGDQSRVTIGHVELSPNHPHTIAGAADFTIIIRDVDSAVIEALTQAMQEEVAKAANAHGLKVEIDTRSRLEPALLDAGLAAMLHEEAEALGMPAHAMPSGAGHDAQTMQAITPSALIFVPSRDGVSHAPQEHTEWSDIEKGAQLMLKALIRLSQAT